MNNTFGQPIGVQQPVFAPKTFKVTNPMTNEDLAVLKKEPDKGAINLELTAEDTAKAKCPHRDANGQPLFHEVLGHPGTFKCKLCHEEFTLDRISDVSLMEAINVIINTLQQVKLYGYTLPVEVYSEYMMMLPLINRLPGIYKLALNSFDEIASSFKQTNQQFVPRGNDFNALNSIFNGTYQQQFQQPMYQQQFQQPMMQTQQFQQPMAPTQPMIMEAQAMPTATQAPAAPQIATQQPFAAPVPTNK